MTHHRTRHILIHVFALIAMLLPALPTLAGKTYYYKVTAKAASPATAAGKVYVSTSSTCSDTDYQEGDKTITGSTSDMSAPSQTFYFFAKTDNTADYNYVQWKSGSTIVSEGALTDGKHSFSKELTYGSTTESSPTTYAYTPYFQKVYVLGSCDGVKCTAVTVSPTLNKLNTQVTLTATLAEGYYVKHWINKNTGEIVESSRQDETMGQNPWTFKVWEEAIYEPVVGESWVTGSSANTSAGTVIVSPSANIEGDEVALLAVPKSGYYDVEWRKKDESEVVSTDNPFRLTVTEKAEYVATFVSGSNTLADGFYRVSCSNPTTSNTDIALVDNLFNMQTIVGSVSTFLNNSAPAIGRAQTQLAQDINLKTQDAALTSPNSIIYLKKEGSQYDLYAQGTHIKELSTGAFYGSNAGKVSSSGAYLDLSRAGDSYLMSLTIPAKASLGSQNMGPFYFSDNNGKFTVLEAQDDHSLWLIEPIDQDDNYFAIQPDASISLNGRYFTTLRLPFAVTIPDGSTLKAHGVTQMPETDGGQATLHTYEAGDIIPAGMPVVIENTSLLPADNKLIPTGDPSAAISTNSSYTVSTDLYNNYGAHRHDNGRNAAYNSDGVDDVPMSGDQVGYFVMNPDYSDNIPTPTCYELGVNENGEIGFWTQVASQTKKVGSTNVTYYPLDGCLAYSTMPCLLFSTCEPTTLAELVASGDTEGRYEITDLTAVAMVDDDRMLICKDDNGAADKDVNDSNAIDYMRQQGFAAAADYDQSNWIGLRLPDGVTLDSDILGRTLTGVKGRLTSADNAVFALDRAPEAAEQGTFAFNTYSPASFTGTQQSDVDHKTYFFVRPKAMEVANIVWAYWNGSRFTAPPRVITGENSWNNTDLQGEFAFNDAFLDGEAPEVDNAYEIFGLITHSPGLPEVSSPMRRRAPAGGDYVVYPFSLTWQGSNEGGVITDVASVGAARQMVSVQYVNVAGQVSDRPWPGMNIVVTRYSDGTKRSMKSIY